MSGILVVRHEIDYLRALGIGETVTARTWVADQPQGAKFDRFIMITDDGEVFELPDYEVAMTALASLSDTARVRLAKRLS